MYHPFCSFIMNVIPYIPLSELGVVITSACLEINASRASLRFFNHHHAKQRRSPADSGIARPPVGPVGKTELSAVGGYKDSFGGCLHLLWPGESESFDNVITVYYAIPMGMHLCLHQVRVRAQNQGPTGSMSGDRQTHRS